MKRNFEWKNARPAGPIAGRANWKTLGAGAALWGTTLGIAPGATFLNNQKIAYAQNYNSPIRVALNGQYINFGNVPPQQVGGRVLVPLRGVFEALGATVNYDAATSTIYATSGAQEIQLRLGSAQAIVNGQMQILDVPAQSRLGRTLVPLRFVSEALGATVQWSAAQQTVFITSSGTPNTQPPIGSVPTVPQDEAYYPPTNLPGANQTTVTGIVERDLAANNEFDIITDSGALLRVRLNYTEPATLSRGDRVQVTGRSRNDYFEGTAVRILNQRENETGQRSRVIGIVEQIFSSTRFTLRTDAGELVNVTTLNNIPENLSRGDRVRAAGQLTGNYLSANRVVVLTQNNPTSNPLPDDDGQTVRFSGIVSSVDTISDTLQVQGDNGRYYIVRYNSAGDFREGDRVRVVGSFSNGVTTATAVTRLN